MGDAVTEDKGRFREIVLPQKVDSARRNETAKGGTETASSNTNQITRAVDLDLGARILRKYPSCTGFGYFLIGSMLLPEPWVTNPPYTSTSRNKSHDEIANRHSLC